MRSGKIESVISKDGHLVVSSSPSDTKSSYKASDAVLATYDKLESRMAEKTAKRRSHRKRRLLKKYNQLSSFSSAADVETDTTSLDSCEDAVTFKTKNERTHRSKKHLNDGRYVIHTVCIGFRRAVNYRKYLLANKSSKLDLTVLKNISRMARRMKAQTKPRMLDLFGSVLIIGFLCSPKLTCDTNKVYEDEPI